MLGGACFAVLVGADGGALAPLHVAAAVAPLATVADAGSRTSVAPHAPARVVGVTAAPVWPWKSGMPIDLNRRNAPLDVSAVVTSVTPVDGPSAGGTTIDIQGSGFTDANDVVIGGTVVNTACPALGGCFTENSDTDITAITPPGTAGTSDVTVDNASFQGTPNPPADDYTYLDQPTVTNVPNQVAERATGVTVTGTGFSIPGPPTASAVSEVALIPTFTGPTIPLTTECGAVGDPNCFGFTSDTRMPIDLPATPILPGQYDTVVTTPGGTSPTSSNDQFVVQQDAPTVTSVSPDSGPDGGGLPAITISGTNFTGSGFATTGVSFGGTPAATFHITNSTTLTATPPAGSGLIDITVTTSSTDGTSVETSVTSSSDTYVYAPVPTVTNVSPNAGPTGGQNVVTLTGAAFESNNSGSNANFAATDVIVDLTDIGTSPCPPTPSSPCFTVNTPTKITIGYMPPHGAGPIHITVETVGGTSTASSGSQYTYQVLPTVTGVSPTAGVLGGGNNITVTGTDFTGATHVLVDGNPFSPCPSSPCFIFGSSTSITFQGLPPHAAGTVDIIVETPAGTSATNPSDQYAYAPVPTVTLLSPHVGSPNPGNIVNVTGTAFESGSNFTTTIVSVGAAAITTTPCAISPTAPCFTVNTATSITIGFMPGQVLNGPDQVDITVTTPGGTSAATSSNVYTYNSSLPTVTELLPRDGAMSGHAAISLFGNGFGLAGQDFVTDVLFGSTDVPSTNAYPCLGSSAGCFIVVGPTQLAIYTPANAAGTVHVTVDTPTGSSTPGTADEYTFVAPGAYTALSPYRVCDTRPPVGGIAHNECNTGVGSNKTLGTNGAVTAQITTNVSGQVPLGAQAVVVNVTAIDHGSSPTYVTAYPAGESRPVSSDISLAGHSVEANLVIVQLSPSGGITLFNAIGSTDVIVDVEGYFAAPTGSAGEFHSIPPLRICDSRGEQGTACAGATSNPIQALKWRDVVLSGLPPGAPGNTPSIPTTPGTATAAVFNLTAVGGTQATYLTVAPALANHSCPTTPPSFSNVNPSAGIALPNRVISSLGPNQDVCVFSAAGSINFVIDVNGWFGSAGVSGGVLFYSVPPTRVCDTRPTSGTECATPPPAPGLGPGQVRVVPMAGVLVVPADNAHSTAPVAVVANLTGVAGTAATIFTLFPSDAGRPRASDLNPSAGEVIANLGVVGLSTTVSDLDGDVSLYNNLGDINAILDVAGWFQ